MCHQLILEPRQADNARLFDLHAGAHQCLFERLPVGERLVGRVIITRSVVRKVATNAPAATI